MSIASLRLATATLLCSLVLSACTSLQPSVPLSGHDLAQGLSVSRSLPEALPDKAKPVPHTQFVLLPEDSAVGLLMPVPFVAEAITSAVNRYAAEALEERLAAVDPYRITLQTLQDRPYWRAQGGYLSLQPFVTLQECSDGQYRLTLIYHLSGPGWVGRYLYHVPQPYAPEQVKAPSPEVLQAVRADLLTGAATLTQLIERGSRGELRSRGQDVQIGSLHLVGGKPSGLVPASLVYVHHADLIEENGQQVLVRIAGDMTQATSAGGLFFGVHVLPRDQLHTFKKL